ncbi:MAG TPA: hydrogenase, partial [Bacilli bacterium]
MILTALSALMVVSTIVLVWLKSIMSAIKILSLQSLLLAAASLSLAMRTGAAELYVIAALSLLVKAALIPYILDRTMRRMNVKRETEKFIGRETSILAAAGIVVFSYAITGHFNGVMTELGKSYLPGSISMLLIGLFDMITHKKAIMQGVGLIVMENGLFLFALSTANGMPFLVDVGIFLDVFVTVILISTLNYRM